MKNNLTLGSVYSSAMMCCWVSHILCKFYWKWIWFSMY